ncbi:MAG TPA: MlaD family protein [Mariprofundaceae bacterium]|nr:MlaD family protein [Mariprofundaceae bacterium]
MGRDYVAGMRRQVGWFVLLGIGALVLLLLVVSLQTNVFAKKFTLIVSPPSAMSFFTGQAVQFQGFTIGRVSDIELREQGEVIVYMQLLDRYRHMLHEGAAARLVKEGWIGESTVELTAGDTKKRPLHDGEKVDYQTEATIEQLLRDLKPAVENANVLLSEMASLAKWANDPHGDLRVALSGMRQLGKINGEQIEQAVERFSAVMGELQAIAKTAKDKKMVEDLSRSLRVTSRILDNLEPLSKSVGQQGQHTMAQINVLLGHVDELTRSLDTVAADLSELTPELPGLARQSRETIEEMQGLLKNLRGSWLFGGGEAPNHKASETETVAPPLTGGTQP